MKMIELLFMLVTGEMALLLTLVFKNPLRKLLILAMDQLKQGRGPLVMKSVGGTMLVVFISILYAVLDDQKRSADGDEVLQTHHLLEASLIGIKSIRNSK